jgi:hypothetical protein
MTGLVCYCSVMLQRSIKSEQQTVSRQMMCISLFVVVMQLFRSADAGDDCDLWKDSLFRSVPRYLCVTRKAQVWQTFWLA